MKKLSQKGFTLVEALLIIIALSLIVGVGFYIMNANKDDDAKTAKSTSSSQTTEKKSKSTAQATTKEYLKIPELGVKIPLTAALKGATYQINPAQENWAGITTPEFSAAVAACQSPDAASSYFKAIGIVEKYEGTRDPNAMPNDVYAEFAKQFPSFYIDYGQADGDPCSGSDTAKNATTKALSDKLAPEVKSAVQHAETL